MFSVVYVLSCGDSGYYPEQCLMSLFTLKKYNPDISATVITDKNTFSLLKGERLYALSTYSNVLSFDVPLEYNTEFLCSRYLKTSLRKLVSGDFIFLDCDTLVCRRFSISDLQDIQIGMVADLNDPLPLSDSNTLEKCRNAGFNELHGVPYFNSGVFFVKDDIVCYRIFDAWHRLWRMSTQKGCSYDQPALAEANRQFGFPIKTLSGEWNCQIKFSNSSHYLHNAFVLHFFSANQSSARPFHEEALLQRISRNGIDPVVAAFLSKSIDVLYAFFSQSSDSVMRYIGSDMFGVYVSDSSTFRLIEKIGRFIQRIKRARHKFISHKK